jgi:hypothetical protein
VIVAALKEGKQTQVHGVKIVLRKRIFLQVKVSNGSNIQFTYSNDGRNFIVLNEQPIDGKFLPTISLPSNRKKMILSSS